MVLWLTLNNLLMSGSVPSKLETNIIHFTIGFFEGFAALMSSNKLIVSVLVDEIFCSGTDFFHKKTEKLKTNFFRVKKTETKGCWRRPVATFSFKLIRKFRFGRFVRLRSAFRSRPEQLQRAGRTEPGAPTHRCVRVGPLHRCHRHQGVRGQERERARVSEKERERGLNSSCCFCFLNAEKTVLLSTNDGRKMNRDVFWDIWEMAAATSRWLLSWLNFFISLFAAFLQLAWIEHKI